MKKRMFISWLIVIVFFLSLITKAWTDFNSTKQEAVSNTL